MVLPGSVRTLFLSEVEAEMKGRASLVAARHEVAAARARANTAKLLQENPHIMRMQELETLAALASKSGNVLIIPGLQSLLARKSFADWQIRSRRQRRIADRETTMVRHQRLAVQLPRRSTG